MAFGSSFPKQGPGMRGPAIGRNQQSQNPADMYGRRGLYYALMRSSNPGLHGSQTSGSVGAGLVRGLGRRGGATF